MRRYHDDPVVVVDDVGVLAVVERSYAERAVHTGQCHPTERPDVFQLIPRPIRPLTPEERRALFLKRTRNGKRSR